jgi:hypothetical protein
VCALCCWNKVFAAVMTSLTRLKLRKGVHVAQRCCSNAIRHNCSSVPIIQHPSLELFEPFFKHAKPVIIKGISKDWKATALWQDIEALKSRVGSRVVPVEIGTTYMDPNLIKNSVAFDLFLHYLQQHELNGVEQSPSPMPSVYLAQTPLAELSLQNDVIIPDICLRTGRGDIYSSNAWIG